MAKCIANSGSYFIWLSTSFNVANVTYSIDTGDSHDNMQVPFLFTDSLSTIIKNIHDAVKSDALSRFSITLADADIRVL